jgi:hypothetical protein
MIQSTTLDTTGLLKPQIPHAMKLLDSLYLNGVACDQSEGGCGKTYSSAWIAKQFNSPLIVICPKSVKSTWKRVLESFDVKATVLVSYEKLIRGGTPYLTYREESKDNRGRDLARYQLVDTHFPAGCLVILDEAHKCKSPISLSSGLLVDAKRKGYKLLLLSATIATNPLEMKAIGYVTNLHNLYQWKDWCLDHGAKKLGRWGALTFNTDDKEAQEKLKVCHHNLFDIQSISSRLTREMMGDIFPDNHINPESFDLGTNSVKIQSVYDNLQYEIARLEKRSENYSSHVFALIMKARVEVEMLKMPFFIECIDEIVKEGSSAVVFVNFNTSLEFLKNNLNHKCSIVVGGQSEKQRDLEISNFQSNKHRVSLNNIKSGGNSISYHDLSGEYPRQSLISPTWSAIDLIQALFRTPRANGKTPCYQRIIYADNTIENRICNRLRSKINNLDCLNDGDLADISII